MNDSGDDRRYGGRERSPKPVLRAIAAQSAILSAATHVLWAWPRLTTTTDPRPATFLLAAVFTVFVAAATVRGGEYRRLYALGAGTLAVFLIGFPVWHGAMTVEALLGTPYAIVSKSAEVVGIVGFVALYRLAPPTEIAIERRRDGTELADRTHAGDTQSEDGDGKNTENTAGGRARGSDEGHNETTDSGTGR